MDAGGAAIVGAHVLMEGTDFGVSTDKDGAFKLPNVASRRHADRPVYRIPESCRCRAAGPPEITLEEASEQIEDVMVVAYGTAKKESFMDRLGGQRARSSRSAWWATSPKSVEGTVCLLQVTSEADSPVREPSITIRGIGSINAAATPLYVVDGIPYDGSLSLDQPLRHRESYGPEGRLGRRTLRCAVPTAWLSSPPRRVRNPKPGSPYKGNVGIASRPAVTTSSAWRIISR